MLLQMKLKAGQTRCCEKRTGENSVSSETSFLGWLVNVLISASVLFSSSTHRPFLSKCKLLFSVFFFVVCVFTRVITRGRASLQTGEDRGDLPAVGAAEAADPGGHSQQETLG